MYIFLHIYSHTLVMYVYTLCFLIHAHMHTHKGSNASHCPNSLKGKTGCNTLSLQHRKKWI